MGNQPSGRIQKNNPVQPFQPGGGGGGGGSGGNMPSFNPSAMATPMIAQSSSSGLVNVNGERVRIFYCMAHGGGSANSNTPMLSYASAMPGHQSLSGIVQRNATNDIFPMIARLVTTSQSAVSSDDSDRINSQNISSILTKGEVYRKIKVMRPARTDHSDKSGSIKQSQDAQVYPANTPCYPEVVSTESTGQTSVPTGTGGKGMTFNRDDWDQKFGIWQWMPLRHNNGWERETATHGQGQSAEAILLDIFKNKRDISIFRVVFELEKIYGKNIIVIFPNCSPVSSVSITHRNLRRMTKPFSQRSKGSGRYTPQASLEMLADILRRANVMYQGNGRLLKFCKGLLDTLPLQLMDGILNFPNPIPAHPFPEKGKIGQTDEEDRKYMYQLMDSWLKEYGMWLTNGDTVRNILATDNHNSNLNILLEFAITSHPEVHALAVEIFGDGQKLINFAMIMLIMLHRIPPFLGGLHAEVYIDTGRGEWGGKRRMSANLDHGEQCTQLWVATDVIAQQIRRLGGGASRPELFKRIIHHSAIMACVMNNQTPVTNNIELVRLAKAKEGVQHASSLALFSGGRKRRRKRSRIKKRRRKKTKRKRRKKSKKKRRKTKKK